MNLVRTVVKIAQGRVIPEMGELLKEKAALDERKAILLDQPHVLAKQIGWGIAFERGEATIDALMEKASLRDRASLLYQPNVCIEKIGWEIIFNRDEPMIQALIAKNTIDGEREVQRQHDQAAGEAESVVSMKLWLEEDDKRIAWEKAQEKMKAEEKMKYRKR